MTKKIKLILPFLQQAIFCYVCLSLALGGSGFILRIFEWAALSHYNFAPTSDLLSNNIAGFGYDVLQYLQYSAILFPVFLIFYIISTKLARILYKIFATASIVISFGFIIYFSIQHISLTKYVSNYSISDILFVINSSNSSPWWFYCFLLIAIVTFFILSRNQKKQPRTSSIRFISILFIIFVVLSFFIFKGRPIKSYSVLQEYYIKKNKISYFISSLLAKSIAAVDMSNITTVVKDFHSNFPHLEFVDKQIPFLHKANYEDVLSPFFNLKPEKPNLVFIIVEGLGTKISGYYDNTQKSFTPFLDSLSNKSLIWQHCYASSQRTFMVPSSLFGPLLCSRVAFAHDDLEYISLLKELYKNGYENNSFFYGGDLKFDALDKFCRDNHITNVIQTWDKDIEQKATGNKWGVDDNLMFKQATRIIDFERSPRIDIYLTISTHEPFLYPDKDYWMQKADNSREFGGFMYVDNAIRELFEFYKKSAGFDNTIFIITGDHYSVSGQALDSYQVPLIIYSSMLKEHKRFEPVVLQRQVTPSLLSLFKNKYHADLSENVTWLGGVLDTSRYYYNPNAFTPLVPAFNEMTTMMHGEYFYDNGELYYFSKDNTLTMITDPLLIKKEELLLQEYILIEQFIMKNYSLIKKDKRTREQIVQEKIAMMKNDSAWLESIKEKALKKNIPLDSALRNDAIWLYEQEQKRTD